MHGQEVEDTEGQGHQADDQCEDDPEFQAPVNGPVRGREVHAQELLVHAEVREHADDRVNQADNAGGSQAERCHLLVHGRRSQHDGCNQEEENSTSEREETHHDGAGGFAVLGHLLDAEAVDSPLATVLADPLPTQPVAQQGQQEENSGCACDVQRCEERTQRVKA